MVLSEDPKLTIDYRHGPQKLIVSRSFGYRCGIASGVAKDVAVPARYWRLHPSCMDGRPLTDEELEDSVGLREL